MIKHTIHRSSPILIVYGDQRDTTLQLRKDTKLFPNITLFPVCYPSLYFFYSPHFFRQGWKLCLEPITGMYFIIIDSE